MIPVAVVVGGFCSSGWREKWVGLESVIMPGLGRIL